MTAARRKTIPLSQYHVDSDVPLDYPVIVAHNDREAIGAALIEARRYPRSQRRGLTVYRMPARASLENNRAREFNRLNRVTRGLDFVFVCDVFLNKVA